ncbi:MAG: alpha-L-fucosidase [Verrucomicrobia bacterium]|nr:alpha-L-fucosidase [Verrucomicrobiota bacterium]
MTRRQCFHLAAALVLVLSAQPLLVADAKPPWLKPDPAAMQRWQEMRFGMFIHWGPVSLTGHEIGWSRGAQTPIEKYDNLYKEFNPTKFNADEWVATAKAAGMKYMVLTTKHHDGFCLFDTKQTDFNIMCSPFGRDVTKELAEACRRSGIAFGTYHSVCDWYHPDFPLTSPGGKVKRDKSDIAAYRRYLRAQTSELIKNYGPLITMWFDVPQQFDRAEGSENVRLCRALQPDILVNNRAGGGCGDYDTPEQRVGGFQMQRPWETCMTICRQWSWKPDDKMKTLPECLQTLIRTTAGDGNLLFNVGPMANGEIEARQIERLKKMGAWLAKHGESIYATRGGPFKPAKHVASTRKGNTIYLHILAWPEEVLKLPALPAKIVKSNVLTGGEAVVKQTAAGIEIAVPKSDRREIDTIVALELDKPAIEIEPISVSSIGQSLTEGKKTTVSNVYQKNAHYAAAMAVDGDDQTRWATDAKTGSCWLEVDLGKPQTFDRAMIQECVDYGVRVKVFELQYKDGDAWKTFHSGKGIGKNLEVKFVPVTARIVRLNITEGQSGPTIFEFQLFAPAARKATP